MNDTILKLLREEHRVIENLIHQIETSREISQKKEFYLVLRNLRSVCKNQNGRKRSSRDQKTFYQDG